METGSDGQFFGRLAVWGCGQKKGAPDRRATLHWWRKGGLLFFSFSQAGAVGAAPAGVVAPSAFRRLEWRRFE
ncbi:hypothetical protein ABIE64_000057 [Thalassospira sp. MBR-102]